MRFRVRSLIRKAIGARGVSLRELPGETRCSVELRVRAVFLSRGAYGVAMHSIKFKSFFLPASFHRRGIVRLKNGSKGFGSLS